MKIKNQQINETATKVWILILLVLVLAAGIAAIWYEYIPETPHTENGHVQH